MELEFYHDLGANVRYNGQYVPIRQLVTPNDPTVRQVADILSQTPDFIAAAQQFVNEFINYYREPGDFWSMPAEVIDLERGDCDCMAILLCSILRTRIPAEKVYCAVGEWGFDGITDGHMWVVIDGGNGKDRILESTAPPERSITGVYVTKAIFNDVYAYATQEGLNDFDLRPVHLRTTHGGVL